MITKSFLYCLTVLALSLSFSTPALAQAKASPKLVEVSFLSGWREADGTHMAALQFNLAPGWKMFWRAPGDGGVPTQIDWTGSSNINAAHTLWPIPEIFHSYGVRAIGYRNALTLPLSFAAATDAPITLKGNLDFGICSDICMPIHIDISQQLQKGPTANVEVISAALHNQPTPAKQAHIGDVSCSITRSNGAAQLDIVINIPKLDGDHEELVIEPSNPRVWVSEPVLDRNGTRLHASANLARHDGEPFTIDPSQIRMTILTDKAAVDIQGCD